MTLRAERYKVSTPFFPLRPAAALLLAALASSAQAQTLPAQPMAGQQFLAAGAGDGDQPPDRRQPEDRYRRRVQSGPLVPDRPGRAPRCWPAHGTYRTGRLFTADLNGWQAVADRVHDGRFAGRCGNAVLRAAPGALPAAGQPAAHFRLGVDLRDGAAGQHAQRTRQRYRCSAGGGALQGRRHRRDAGRANGSHTFEITLPQAVAGLVVDWADGARGAARLQAQDARGRWRDLAHDAQTASHRQSWLAATAACVLSA